VQKLHKNKLLLPYCFQFETRVVVRSAVSDRGGPVGWGRTEGWRGPHRGSGEGSPRIFAHHPHNGHSLRDSLKALPGNSGLLPNLIPLDPSSPPPPRPHGIAGLAIDTGFIPNPCLLPALFASNSVFECVSAAPRTPNEIQITRENPAK